MSDPAAGSHGEQKWLGPIVALLVLSAVPLVPVLRIIAPIERTVYLIVPALAVCALLGWRAGGGLTLALVWVVLAAWALSAPDASASPHFDRLQRGWSLLVAGAFGVSSVVAPEKNFLVRGMGAVVLALAIATGVVVTSGGQAGEILEVVTSEFASRNQDFVDAYQSQLTSNATLRAMAAEGSLLANMAAEAPARLQQIAVRAAVVFPALLALESLAVLALAWSLFHRLSRTRIGNPLNALSEFRFDDKLIWGLLLGLALLLPRGRGELSAAGWTLVVFFGGLYALRGLAVAAWLLRPRGKWVAAVFVVAMIALPVYGLAALLGLGVGDTWVDWRHRPPSPS